MNNKNLYVGREHSLIKHELLKNYLEKLLFIVASGGVKEITYIDCFAGPWGDESEDLEGTSIAISLNILSKVKMSLEKAPHNKNNIKYRAIFIEKDKNRYKKLSTYLNHNSPDYIECHHINDDYFNCQDEILKLCGISFAFFFIDPKGWRDVGIPKLHKFLARKNSEFLINFMYDFLNRAVGMEAQRNQVSQLLGALSDSQFEEFTLLNSNEREEKIVNYYRELLKKFMPSRSKARSYYSTVLFKDKERTKYHMVYLTSHPKGIVEFSRISEHVDIFQRKVRCQTQIEKKQNDTGMIDLFGINQNEFQNISSINIHDVRQFWLETLSNKPQPYSESDLADILEKTGWLESDLQEAFGSLIKDNSVENIDIKGRRISKYIHFNKNERLKKIL